MYGGSKALIRAHFTGSNPVLTTQRYNKVNMKEILEKIYDKKIEYVQFKQYINVYPKQYKDGEIYETEVDAEEPSYIIEFVDGTKTVIDLSELIVKIFNSKTYENNSNNNGNVDPDIMRGNKEKNK